MTPVVRNAAEGRTVAVVGDVYRFLVTGAETGGAYAAWEVLVLPGGGPPPHIHRREVEGFYLLEGEITFDLGEERLVAGPGHACAAPIGVRHSFRNESERPARCAITIAPAGLEEMFFEVGVPLAAGATDAAPPTTAEEIERLMALAPKYGVEILKP